MARQLVMPRSQLAAVSARARPRLGIERERERERLGNVPLRPRHPGRPPQLTRDTEGFRDPSDERERTL